VSGWVLRDKNSPLRTLVGTLTNVFNTGNDIGEDGDTNLIIVPDAADDASVALLRNRNGVVNPGGTIECEVNVTEDGDGRRIYEGWVSSMIGKQVTAKGVYVDDEGHNDRTEIHPMDLIFARMDVLVDSRLFLYRYAAASDDRGGIFLEDAPLAKQTRTTSVTLPFPVRPAGAIGPRVKVRTAGARNAGSHINTTVTGDTAAAELIVTVKAVGDGGPGFDLAEVALDWEGTRSLDMDPPSLEFGLAKIGEAIVRRFTIDSVGSEPVTVTVPGSPFPSPFEWNGVPSTVLAPGGSVAVTVVFSPQVAGNHTRGVSVISDAPGSPHIVSLHGRALDGDPQ